MDTLISAGRRALVLAMASVLAAGGTVLASGPGTAAMDPEMVAALERDLGMSRQQYSAALEVERQIPALESSAQELFGEHYAGTWIEYGVSGDPRVVVGTTRGIRHARLGDAEIREVTYSLAQLDQAVTALDATTTSRVLRRLDGVQSWGVDVAGNRVVVTLSPGAARERAALDFLAASHVDTGILHFEFSEQVPSTLINIYGGIRYNGCSIGFPVTRGATKGFVTAGHCGGVGTAVRINGVHVGSFQRSNFPGSDAAWATVRQQDMLFNRVWQYSGGATYAVTGSQEASIGAATCRSGFRTGWRCGTITRNNVTVNYPQGAVRGLRESNACAGQGDSGGAWVASANQAQGVTSGGALGSDGTNCGIAQGQRRTWFQRLNPMLNSYGVNLVTR